MLRAVSQRVSNTRSVFTSETGRRADFYCQLSSSAAVRTSGRTEVVTVKIYVHLPCRLCENIKFRLKPKFSYAVVI